MYTRIIKKKILMSIYRSVLCLLEDRYYNNKNNNSNNNKSYQGTMEVMIINVGHGGSRKLTIKHFRPLSYQVH